MYSAARALFAAELQHIETDQLEQKFASASTEDLTQLFTKQALSVPAGLMSRLGTVAKRNPGMLAGAATGAIGGAVAGAQDGGGISGALGGAALGTAGGAALGHAAGGIGKRLVGGQDLSTAMKGYGNRVKAEAAHIRGPAASTAAPAAAAPRKVNVEVMSSTPNTPVRPAPSPAVGGSAPLQLGAAGSSSVPSTTGGVVPAHPSNPLAASGVRERAVPAAPSGGVPRIAPDMPPVPAPSRAAARPSLRDMAAKGQLAHQNTPSVGSVNPAVPGSAPGTPRQHELVEPASRFAPPSGVAPVNADGQVQIQGSGAGAADLQATRIGGGSAQIGKQQLGWQSNPTPAPQPKPTLDGTNMAQPHPSAFDQAVPPPPVVGEVVPRGRVPQVPLDQARVNALRAMQTRAA